MDSLSASVISEMIAAAEADEDFSSGAELPADVDDTLLEPSLPDNGVFR